MKAIWNGKVIAESNNTTVIENNHYFPRDSVKDEYLSDSDLNTICPWKGTASYYNIKVDEQINENAAWYYPETKDAAKEIQNKIAFWKGVEIVK